MNYKIKKISGDASFREFYRVKKGLKSSIIVKANKEKQRNLINYIIINKVLNENKINAPKLINNYFENSMIEISDLGEKSFYDFIISKKNKLSYYKKLIKLIIKLQKIRVRKEYKIGKYKLKFEKYTKKNLHKESDLFFDWYLANTLGKIRLTKRKKIKKVLKDELDNIYKQLSFKNIVFVHRDFHASNIMMGKKKLGLIDNQDAIIGNPLYDIASLVDDVRIKFSNDFQKRLLKFYHRNSQFRQQSFEKIKNDYDILSVQRNLKILGIFVRLYKRDKKPNYLRYLPYTWQLIMRRLKNPIFKTFKFLLIKNLPIKKLAKVNIV